MRFVDTNVFVYHLAADPKFGRRATGIIEMVEKGESAAISTLTLAQICGYLKRRTAAELIPRFLSFIRSIPNLTKVDTAYTDFIDAQVLQEKENLDWKLWDDLVIAAQMSRMKAREIYSNDEDFDKIPGIKRIFERII